MLNRLALSLALSVALLGTLACSGPVYSGPRKPRQEVALLRECGGVIFRSIGTVAVKDLPLVVLGDYELLPGGYQIVVSLIDTMYKTEGNMSMFVQLEAGHKYVAAPVFVGNTWTAQITDSDSKQVVSQFVKAVPKWHN